MSKKAEEFSKILLKLLKENDLSQRDLAKELFISDSTMSYYISGKTFPSYEVLVQMAKKFNVSLDYLFNIKPVETITEDKIINIPVYKDIKYNDSLDGTESKNIEFIFPVVADRYKNCNKLFAKIITTNEMNPRIMPNDIVIFDLFRLGVDKLEDGDICLVSKGNENAVVREIAIKNDVFCFNLFNVNMPPRMYSIEDMRKENITIIGKAIKLVHEFKRGH